MHYTFSPTCLAMTSAASHSFRWLLRGLAAGEGSVPYQFRCSVTCGPIRFLGCPHAYHVLLLWRISPCAGLLTVFMILAALSVVALVRCSCFDHGFCYTRVMLLAALYVAALVWCSFWNKILHSRMPLYPTPLVHSAVGDRVHG
jgi:hypothetical protein